MGSAPPCLTPHFTTPDSPIMLFQLTEQCKLLHQLYKIRTNVTGTFFSSNFFKMPLNNRLGDCKQSMCTAALLLEPKQ